MEAGGADVIVTSRHRPFRITNSAALIQEIKKHVILYDPKSANNNPDLKKKSWDAVAAGMLGDRWRTHGINEREALVREIQTKWKSLRDNFTRVLRKEKEDEATGVPTKRKKYIYYDDLLFLAPYTTFRKSTPATMDDFSNGESDSKRNVIYVNECKDSGDETQYVSTEENPLQTTEYIKFQAAPSDDGDNGNLNRKVTDLLGQLMAQQREEKYDDPMGNKKFLLSLLPFMKKLPDDVNLEVRLQVMSVLQSYSSGKSVL